MDFINIFMMQFQCINMHNLERRQTDKVFLKCVARKANGATK